MDLEVAYAFAQQSELQQNILEIYNQFENELGEYREELSLLNDINNQELASKLRSLMIEYFNIGHNWNFSKKQICLLQKYYEANILLSRCLYNDLIPNYISEEVAETILLPIAEIEKRKQSNS
ncbi:MAG: hypothetical protein AAGE84_21830 [Cyanobacteria bacterium P01_G01_bin.39]